MAEFAEVMRQWRRMCSSIKGADCTKCPLYPYVCKTPWQDNQTPWDVVEKRISTWAAEHPEPVYPSWGEWLAEQGELCKNWKDIRVISSAGNSASGVIGWFYKNIPADIAEKLGIEPKEG